MKGSTLALTLSAGAILAVVLFAPSGKVEAVPANPYHGTCDMFFGPPACIPGQQNIGDYSDITFCHTCAAMHYAWGMCQGNEPEAYAALLGDRMLCDSCYTYGNECDVCDRVCINCVGPCAEDDPDYPFAPTGPTGPGGE